MNERERTTFIFNKRWYDVLQEYSTDIQFEVYNAIIVYATSGVIVPLSQIGKMAFSFIRKDIDSYSEKFDAKCAKLQENGKKGGRPKKTIKNQKNQMVSEKPNETKRKQKNHEYEYEYEYEYENMSNENENINNLPPFIPPKGENHEKNENGDLEFSQIIPNDEKEKEKSCAKKEKETRHKYGTYMNVLLTDEEYGKIISMPNGAVIIDFFSEMKEMKGYTYKRDYLAIKKWGIRAYEELSTTNQQTAGHNPRNTFRSDADNKRRELDHINQISLAILSSPPP